LSLISPDLAVTSSRYTRATRGRFNEYYPIIKLLLDYSLCESPYILCHADSPSDVIGYSHATASSACSELWATLSKLQESIDALKEKFPSVDYRALEINLSSQKSVRAAAAELLSWSDVPAIDILVDSAGVMNIPERTLSEDGIEIHFATNYIGHYLFAYLIMPKLIEASRKTRKGETRMVNVSSLSPQWTHAVERHKLQRQEQGLA
jgi:NAD(P)-dependent dehydrogenase (short-subunit alcohol dehydrogenase family)